MGITIASVDSGLFYRHTDFMDGQKELGNLIRSARERKGWDQRRLGVAISRDNSFISRLETGTAKNTLDARTLRDIASALSISPVLMLEAMGYLEAEDTDSVSVDFFTLPERVKNALRKVEWDDLATALVLNALEDVIPRMQSAARGTLDFDALSSDEGDQ